MTQRARCGLTIAMAALCACVAPEPARYGVDVLERSGALPLELDRRLYVDKPFELTLPGGPYEAVALWRVEREFDLERMALVERSRALVLRVDAGDPRLAGDPVRLALPSEWGKRYDERVFRVRAEHGDGRSGELCYAFIGR